MTRRDLWAAVVTIVVVLVVLAAIVIVSMRSAIRELDDVPNGPAVTKLAPAPTR